METYAYGFPRLGKQREFKKTVENFWDKKISEQELFSRIKEIELQIIDTYKKYVDYYPSFEMTLYDNMLDTALMLGIYEFKDIYNYFSLCRGKNALEMTKWFNTNYHYLVPEIDKNFTSTKFQSKWNKLESTQDGIAYIIGGFTFLKLSKGYKKEDFKELLIKLVEPYKKNLSQFKKIHIDEPAFVLDLSDEEIKIIKQFYNQIAETGIDIYLFTYYDSVDFLEHLYELPVKAIGLDFIYGKENFDRIKKIGFPDDKTLIAGIVDGRNVWRSNINQKVEVLKELSKYAKKIMASNASPLYHLPVTIKSETELPKELINMLSFAEERLFELQLIKKMYNGEIAETDWYKETEFGKDKKVQERIQNLKEENFIRKVPYSERKKIHSEKLNLPLFPTTTIGSYPQTPEIRNRRKQFKAGEITKEEYRQFIKSEIKKLIELQEDIGLDVLTHGEFERTDMVEFFAQRLNGIATTKQGWVLSYGTRGYRPPIIYGDISRPGPMTTEEILYAQSLTDRPVKGMLTGPVTIIAWSYVRTDVNLKDVAYQIALCLQDEIKDYHKAGIKIVQIDEPAFREKAPLKKRAWHEYFDWAVKAFRLASNVNPEIQIHTHMCYSEFGEIIEYIVNLDFDVISIEASRSKADIVEDFKKVNFDRQIGLGVWDIHSPLVPSIEEMEKVVKKALAILPEENFWINPDCGLKTRKWDEVIPSLKNLVRLAQKLREEFKMGRQL